MARRSLGAAACLRRDVLESHQRPALGMARQRQGTGGKNQGPLTLSRKRVIHFNGLEPMTAGKQLFELRPQRGKLKEHCVEGAIARLDSLVGVQHDERIGNRVERSEEHTSELQSPCNLVCRLLLEKKKNKNII